MYLLPKKGTCVCKTICKLLRFFPPFGYTDINVLILYFKMFSFKWHPWAFGIKCQRKEEKQLLLGRKKKKRNKGNTGRSNKVLMVISHLT